MAAELGLVAGEGEAAGDPTLSKTVIASFCFPDTQ